MQKLKYWWLNRESVRIIRHAHRLLLPRWKRPFFFLYQYTLDLLITRIKVNKMVKEEIFKKKGNKTNENCDACIFHDHPSIVEHPDEYFKTICGYTKPCKKNYAFTPFIQGVLYGPEELDQITREIQCETCRHFIRWIGGWATDQPTRLLLCRSTLQIKDHPHNFEDLYLKRRHYICLFNTECESCKYRKPISRRKRMRQILQDT